MKGLLGVFLLAVAATTGCSVDLSRLRAGPARDAAASAAADLPPKVEPDATGEADGRGEPDAPTAIIDRDGPVDDRPVDERDGTGDPADHPETGKTDARRNEDSSMTPDLPEASPDLPAISPDLPDASPDLASDGADSAISDVSPEARDANAPNDWASPPDARDTGGLGNGAACTSADQCQSGFCLASRCCVQSCASACYRANQCSRTGSCTPAAGAITCGDLDALCGLTVYDSANAYEWSLQPNLQIGNLATGSDQHTLSAVPSALAGSPWIRPSRGSKTAVTNPLLTFTLSAPADVYVGIDARISMPSWLSGWTDAGLTISYLVYSTYEPTTTVTQRLLTARFPAGDVALGPLGCTSTSDCSMYLTIIRFADQQSEAPACR